MVVPERPWVKSDLAARVEARTAERKAADLAEYRKAIVAAADGKPFAPKQVDDLAILLVHLGLSADDFDRDVSALGEHRALTATVAAFPDPVADEKAHIEKVAELRAVVEKGRVAGIELNMIRDGYPATVTDRAQQRERLRQFPSKHPRLALGDSK